MPDISMCKGGDCKLKHQCYRFLAEPNPHRQSYFEAPPFVEKFTGTSCEHFWEPAPLVIKKGSE